MKKKSWDTTLLRQSQRVGWLKPGNIKNHYFEKFLLSMVLNLTVYDHKNVIFFFYGQKKKTNKQTNKQTNGEIPIFRTFWTKYSILALISL